MPQRASVCVQNASVRFVYGLEAGAVNAFHRLPFTNASGHQLSAAVPASAATVNMLQGKRVHLHKFLAVNYCFKLPSFPAAKSVNDCFLWLVQSNAQLLHVVHIQPLLFASRNALQKGIRWCNF